ncbi:MAG: type I-E CRISPR-associated protein Cse1/CasA [Hyphomicrobiales bacterium]|nr:type I-E CRISPR-associated protein Cse1/CasA [Hyphomicrobiales bacterium]
MYLNIRVVLAEDSSDGITSLLPLPELLGKLSVARVVSFPALRAHQAPAWRAFLVQVAVMGIETIGLDEAPGDDPAAWGQVLRALTPDSADTAWSLIAPPDKPAFLQPPAPDMKEYTGRISTPDALDVLVTSKNHDAKVERQSEADQDDWAFALVSLQTQEGFMGAGNFGISRMNGGFGSRPYLMMRAADSLSFWDGFRRDVDALLAARQSRFVQAERRGFDVTDGVKLLWLKPWDGRQQLSVDELNPLFVEICRRVRLIHENGRIVAATASSAKARIAAKDFKGDLNDPWGAVESGDEQKLLSITSDGFNYKRMVQILFGDASRKYRRGLLAEPAKAEKKQDLLLECFALARGQGKTEGFHTRSVSLPRRAAWGLSDGTEAEALARLANERVEVSGTVASKALRPALIVLTQKGPEEPAWKKPANEPMTRDALARFNAAVDETFFPALWRDLDLGTDEAREKAWANDLAAIARQTFVEALDAAPRSEVRRIIAEARARNMLESSLYKHLPSLRNTKAMEADNVTDAA